MKRTILAFIAFVLSVSSNALPLSALFLVLAFLTLIQWKELFASIRILRKKN